MKQLKNRKTLTLVLCLVLVSVFTLTIAYSALSAVLTISGNARVSAADWDIYLNNPRVTNGSATTNVPVIKTSSTLEFETTLNMPGDFYEFVVDVVNGGDIDAMIENVVKTPDLTEEQAKFLKYEITYQNGESITTKQLLAKDTTMPIKVRIEYRKDLNNGDLPTGQVVLDLSLTLEYIQSDGTGNSVTNNGVQVISANGDINEIGTIVTIGSEQFYTILSDEDSVTMLSKMNITTDTTPKQSSSASDVAFSSTVYWSNSVSNYPAYIYNESSILYSYVENYRVYLESQGVEIEEARLIKTEELETLGCSEDDSSCLGAPEWVYETSYWSGMATNAYYVCYVSSDTGSFFKFGDYRASLFGVRPVITISKDYFN